MDSEFIKQGKEQEQEIMSILLSSSLYVEMSAAEREQLLRYLVTSYFQPRVGENCLAHLSAVRSVSGSSAKQERGQEACHRICGLAQKRPE